MDQDLQSTPQEKIAARFIKNLQNAVDDKKHLPESSSDQTESQNNNAGTKIAKNFILRIKQKMDLKENIIKSNEKKLRHILQNEVRSLDDIKFLAQEIENLDFFKDFRKRHTEIYEKDSLFYFCKVLKYHKYQPNSTIYHQGDHTNGKIYIVLSGEASICINSKESDNIKPSAPKDDEPKNLQNIRRNLLNSISSIARSHSPSTPKRSSQFDNKLKQGSYFGDQESREGETRKSTIIADTECELITIEQKDIVYVKKAFPKVNWNLIEAFQKHLPDIKPTQIQKLIEKHTGIFEEVILWQEDELIAEGKEGNHFYIIGDGECKIFRKWSRKLECSTEFELRAISNFYQISKEQAAKVSIGTIKYGAFIGEEIFLNENNQYDHSIQVCSNEVKIYKVEKDKFASVFPEEIVDYVKRQCIKRKKATEDAFLLKMDCIIKEVYDKTKRRSSLSLVRENSLDSLRSPNSPKLIGSPSIFKNSAVQRFSSLLQKNAENIKIEDSTKSHSSSSTLEGDPISPTGSASPKSPHLAKITAKSDKLKGANSVKNLRRISCPLQSNAPLVKLSSFTVEITESKCPESPGLKYQPSSPSYFKSTNSVSQSPKTRSKLPPILATKPVPKFQIKRKSGFSNIIEDANNAM
jgi:CRP-like cAMP-binding protein